MASNETGWTTALREYLEFIRNDEAYIGALKAADELDTRIRSDAEQLMELRRIADVALKYVEADVELLTCETHEHVSWCADCESRNEAKALADQLRAALNPDLQKETQ